jgi:predicted DNA-binding transcriptional regulator YafY
MPARLHRADRLDELVRHLRDRPGSTAADLAAALGVSGRSIFRDLDHLRDRGYPIEGDRGRGGGLRLRGNWGIGRVLLAREEALATLLALAVSERLGLPMFARDLARARRRVVDAFPADERRRLAPLRERIFVGPPASPAVRASYATADAAAARALQAAFVDERVVTLGYRAAGQASAARVVEPHALLVNLPAWYLIAIDRGRGASVVAMDERFRARPREMVSDLVSLGVPVEQL